MARLNSASSLRRPASCKRTRIAQISFSLNGAFWPTSLPLFQGSRGAHTFDKCSMVVSRCLRNNQSAPELNGRSLILMRQSQLAASGLYELLDRVLVSDCGD